MTQCNSSSRPYIERGIGQVLRRAIDVYGCIFTEFSDSTESLSLKSTLKNTAVCYTCCSVSRANTNSPYVGTDSVSSAELSALDSRSYSIMVDNCDTMSSAGRVSVAEHCRKASEIQSGAITNPNPE